MECGADKAGIELAKTANYNLLVGINVMTL
jgi:hypothetical protein